MRERGLKLKLDNSAHQNLVSLGYYPDETILEQQRQSGQLTKDVWSAISNAAGQIRLKPARSFISRPTQHDIPLMRNIYQAWVKQPEWMLIEGTHRETGEKQRLAVKTSKRGNDVFQRRMEQRLGFMKKLDRIEFFQPEQVQQKQAKTPMIWLTLTWDPSKNTLDEAWRLEAKEWNLAITKLRKKYGQISVLKFVEAFPDPKGQAYGYPHFHVVLWFHETTFNVFLNWEKDTAGRQGTVYRIQEKQEFKDTLQWKAHSDIKALRTMDAVIDYCRKHEQGSFELTRSDGSENQEALMNCTMQWFYHKRTFAVSSDFQQKVIEFIRHLRNSNWQQARLNQNEAPLPIWIWENKGIRSMHELIACGLNEEWTHRVVDPDVWDRLVNIRASRWTINVG